MVLLFLYRMPCVPGALHSAALLREEADPCPDADTALPRDRFPRETGRIRTNAVTTPQICAVLTVHVLCY